MKIEISNKNGNGLIIENSRGIIGVIFGDLMIPIFPNGNFHLVKLTVLLVLSVADEFNLFPEHSPPKV